MIEMTKWIERKFSEKPDPGTFPMLVERLAGAAARIEEKIATIPAAILTQRIGDGWTIQEHIGHLGDAERLWTVRLDEFLAGAKELTAADLSKNKERAAKHNERDVGELASAFRESRTKLVERLVAVDAKTVVASAMHPRLRREMRLIELCSFIAEHDDHHLAKMSEVWRASSK